MEHRFHTLAVMVLSVVASSALPLLFITGVLLVAGLFKILWNDTVPRNFRVVTHTFAESFRLLLMAWLLSGGVFFRFGSH